MNIQNTDIKSKTFYSFSLCPKSELRTKLWWQIQIICRNQTGYIEGEKVQAAIIRSLNNAKLSQTI